MITMAAASALLACLLLLVLLPGLTLGLSCQSAVSGGNWHKNTTWTDCGGSVPGPGDVVSIGGSALQRDVTINSGSPAVQVAALLVNSGRLLNKGTLTADSVLVQTASLISTGKLAVVAVADNATLIVDSGVLTHSGSLTVNGTAGVDGSAYVRVSSSSVTIEGSLSVLSSASSRARVIISDSRASVDVDLSVTGGYASYQATNDDVLHNSASGLGAVSSSITVKGDVKITSQYGQPAIGGGATGNVALWSQGSDLTVRGDLAVQSADAGAGANSGFAELATAQSGAEMPPSSGLSVSNIVVGGALMVGSGDGGDNESGQGGAAGETVVALFKSMLAANGSAGAITVQGGSGGSGSDGGGDGAAASVVVAYGGAIKVTRDLALTGGQGGLGGGRAGSALLSVEHGGEVRVGADALLVSGNGGDGHANFTNGGNGGVSGLLIRESGSVTIKRNAIFTSGRGGTGGSGGSSFTSYLAALPTSAGIRKRTATIAPNSVLVAIGGDLRLVSQQAGNGSVFGGGNCIASQTTSLTGDVGGIVLDVYNAQLAVAGDVVIGACSGGNGFGVRGGAAGVTAITSIGGSLAVGGSVSVTGGDGGFSVNSTGGGGNGAIAFLVGDTHCTVDIAGSLTLASGRGGDAINGIGNGGDVAASDNSEDLAAGIALYGSSRVTVAGRVNVTSGPSGSVSAESVDGAAGWAGSPAAMSILADDSSSFTAGDVSVVGGDMGSAVTNVAGEESDDSTTDHSNTTVSASGKGVITITGNLYVKGGNGGSENLRAGHDAGSAQIEVSSFARAFIRGSATVLGGSGGNTSSTSGNGGNGGIAMLNARSHGQVVFDNLALRGGAAGQGSDVSFDGELGPALATVSFGAAVFQSGKLTMRGGGARNASVSAPTRYAPNSIALTASEWTVYPCGEAGISFASSSEANSFALALGSKFRDCRGSDAYMGYPAPVLDAAGSASCAPCTCSESAYSSCPASPASTVLPLRPLAALLSFFF